VRPGVIAEFLAVWTVWLRESGREGFRGRGDVGERSFRSEGNSSSPLSSPFKSSASNDTSDTINTILKYSKYLGAAKHRQTAPDRGKMIVRRTDCSRTVSGNCWSGAACHEETDHTS
jgi:hypothetical protein